MPADLIPTVIAYVTAAVTAATFLLQAIASITKITPNTRDDELVETGRMWIKRVQKVLGMIALDTSATRKSSNDK